MVRAKPKSWAELVGATFGRGFERGGLLGREAEAALQELPDQAAARLVQAVVHAGDLDEQRRDRDFELVCVICRDLVPRPLLEQRPQAIEHESLRTMQAGNVQPQQNWG